MKRQMKGEWVTVTAEQRGGFYCATGRIENQDQAPCQHVILVGMRAVRKQWAPGRHYYLCGECGKKAEEK